MYRKVTLEMGNAFLAHEPIPGLRFEHNDFVRIMSGEYAGESGSLVSLEGFDEDDPLFLVELEAGFDCYARQSEMVLFTKKK